MTDFNQNLGQAKDMLNIEEGDIQKLPQMLNVLTILTYIGCALAALQAIYSYFAAETAYKVYQTFDTNSANTTGNAAVDNLMSGAAEIAKKSYDNRLMILVFGLVGAALCFYGAMQMRNLKKQGFIIYLAGELLPTISFAIFIGFGSLLGGATAIFSSLFAIIFIVLYATQRKYLVN